MLNDTGIRPQTSQRPVKMKRLIVILLVLCPVIFASCQNVEDITKPISDAIQKIVGSFAPTAATGKHTVTQDTTFQTLISWGIPSIEIENVIGGRLPVNDTTIRTYCVYIAKIDLQETLSALQKLADKYP
jgi:hypothetical protein